MKNVIFKPVQIISSISGNFTLKKIENLDQAQF